MGFFMRSGTLLWLLYWKMTLTVTLACSPAPTGMTADPGRASSPPPGLHSLRIATSSVSEPGTWRSWFFGVGYVDDTEVARFDSDAAGQSLKLPLKIFDDPVRVNLTRKIEQHEQTSRANLNKLRAPDDQSEDGPHTFQEMTGCVVGSDRLFLRGFSQFAYDGVYLNQDPQKRDGTFRTKTRGPLAPEPPHAPPRVCAAHVLLPSVAP